MKLLNPGLAEKNYDAYIERNIKRRLGIRSVGERIIDAARTPSEYYMPDCVLQ